mgnify:CR=1 FL=1
MLIKSIGLILFFINSHSIIFSQFEYKELLFIPWGNKSGQIKLREDNSGRIGPTSFSVNDESVFVLDFNNKHLKQYLKGQHKSNIPIENPLHDIFFINKYGEPVFSTFQNFLVNKDISIKIKDNSTISIKGSEIDIVFKDSLSIGFGQYLGKTVNNHHYVYIENIIQHIPLLIERKILVVDQVGKVKIIFQYPNNNYTYIPQEFFVNDGNLFFLTSRNDGVTVSGWIYNDQALDSLVIYSLPEDMLRGNHYNFDIQNSTDPDSIIETDSENESFIYPPVSPSEALETADAYVNFNWTAENFNITDGLETDLEGVMIQTPEWIQVGDNYHIPYKWGGFNTLDEFSSGLLENKFAGDRITDCSQNYCVSNYCIGVDCSGFVSRCWNLSTHYSTAMMDDDITIAYETWDDLNPGDAIHKVGHVRMVVFKNNDGSILTVEASGYDWKVSYRSYNLSQLTAYSPRYYQGMEGTAGSIPIPKLSSVIKEDEIILNWRLNDYDGISGFNIYGYSPNESWTLLNSLDTLTTSLNLINQTNPIYFNLTSISSMDGVVEGFNSDSYGAYEGSQLKDILIVDGFDRTSGSYPFSYHSFGMRMGQALSPWGYSFDTIDNDELLSGNILLEDYETIFWLLGDESTADETFSAFEQSLVKDYLTQGGKIFISGSEIAWDLDHMGNELDKSFINNYLKTKYDLDDSNYYEVIGNVESVFSGLTLHYDNGNYGVYEENYPDAFLCIGGSLPALNYGNGLIAATHYTGTISTSQNVSQIFVLGFPFETIYNESERVALAGNVLYYFGYDVQLEKMEDQINPEEIKLYANYPNPFNPLTKIKYSVPEYSRVKIIIFDVLGRKVKTLVDDNHDPGNHLVEWDATNERGINVSSGLYFYKIQSGEYTSTNKMCFIK